jgi:hypothetical protein
VVHEGDDGVGAGVDRRGGSAVVGEAQVAQRDGGVAFRGGRRGKALLLPAARPTLDLNRGGSELRGREVGPSEFAPEEFLAARATERRTRCARRMGGWKGKMEGAEWFGGCPSAFADRRYRKKGTGLVATVPFEKRDGRD